jgi:hypothetical protein
MNDARAFHTATLLPGGVVLVVGGLPDTSNSSAALSSAELFDPATGTWTHTTPMNDTHAGHTATLLSFGPVQELGGYVVLIAGGMGSFGSISSSAELYKPPPPINQAGPTAGTLPEAASVAALATGSWVFTGQMNVPRMFHTATALPPVGPLHSDPQVLVAGGPDPGNEVTTGQTTEVFDLATGSWTLTGSMHSDRTGHLAAALEDGRVFVAGGLGGAFGGPTDPVSSAEVGTTCSSAAKLVVSPPQTIHFGQVHAGMQFNNALSLPTIQNTGNALLTLQATISGPDAALFGNNGAPIDLALGGTGSCLSGPPGDGAAKPVFVQFAAWSPVARTCTATLTLGGSNAANTSPGQTWVCPDCPRALRRGDRSHRSLVPSSRRRRGHRDRSTGHHTGVPGVRSGVRRRPGPAAASELRIPLGRGRPHSWHRLDDRVGSGRLPAAGPRHGHADHSADQQRAGQPALGDHARHSQEGHRSMIIDQS